MRPHVLGVHDDVNLCESLTVALDEDFDVHTAATGAPAPPPVAGLVGRSPSIQQVIAHLHAVADTPATVLLIGESGTGKELFARALHQASPRRHRPFVAVNCAAIPEGCVTSTLFGHTRGAFTGATQSCKGVFARAHTGSLFLDEVSGLSLAAQGALLRVLQERQITRLGSTQAHPVDVRLIAATNQDLPQLVRAGTFREDVFHRLAVIPITIPPLRERSMDIPLLVAHFLAKYNQALGRQVPGLTSAALQALCHYAWPGNVRELENLMIRLVALGPPRRLEAVEVHTLLQ